MSSFEVAKDIWEQMSKPPKGGIVTKKNLVIGEHNSSSKRSNKEMHHPNIMSAMVTDVDTSEDKIEELEKKINMLMKAVEERDNEITSLKSHIESRDAAKSSYTHTTTKLTFFYVQNTSKNVYLDGLCPSSRQT